MDDQSIFWKYERNSTYYHTCKNLKKCPTALRIYNDPPPHCHKYECFCHRKQLVLPVVIGEVYCPPTFHVRSYMKIGEICAICIEPILHKINAHLTCCGHSFHKTCMLATMHHTFLTQEFKIVCPMCRNELGSDIGDVFDRYQLTKESTGLDKLENYTMRHEYMLPEICFDGVNQGGAFGKLHYLGMNTTCTYCKSSDM